jgi:CRP/FNR family transcriptional regulator
MQNKETLWKNYFPAFFKSDDSAVTELMNSATVFECPDHQQLFYPGKACQNYLLLISGSIRAQIISDSGEELLLYHVRPGDACVLTTSCLLGGNDYPAEGMTETAVQGFLIPDTVFHQTLQKSPFFQKFVFQNFSNRLAEVIQRMASIRFGSLNSRLAKLLLSSEQSQLQITHQALADELATAREVVSRHLKRLEGYGILVLHRGSIEILDAAALARISKAFTDT